MLNNPDVKRAYDALEPVGKLANEVIKARTGSKLSQLLSDAGRKAKITKKVSAGSLRDLFVVRSVKQGGTVEEAFEKIGLAKSSYDDARKKYGRLTSEAL